MKVPAKLQPARKGGAKKSADANRLEGTPELQLKEILRGVTPVKCRVDEGEEWLNAPACGKEIL